MRTILLVATVICFSLPIYAQESSGKKPCGAPEWSQFDYWVGEWDLTWTDKEGKKLKGTNAISKVYNDCVIKEEFLDLQTGFAGTSVSTFSAATNQWKQTWVDNTGSYLDFTGGFESSRMIMMRKFTQGGKEVLQRMQWYNIASNSLDWNWERSDDMGETWAVLWKIHYSRK